MSPPGVRGGPALAEGTHAATSLAGLHRRAVEQFGARVRAVQPHQWHQATPCTMWDVHDLVNHMVNENLWTVPLLEGRTMEEVGDRYEGDLLGEDPLGSWEAAAGGAVAASAREGALERIVHVSFGDIPGEEYVRQLTTDHLVHAWDLARAVGAGDELDTELVEFVYEYLLSSVHHWREAGVVGPELQAPAGADRQTRLLALVGRRA